MKLYFSSEEQKLTRQVNSFKADLNYLLLKLNSYFLNQKYYTRFYLPPVKKQGKEKKKKKKKSVKVLIFEDESKKLC